MKNNGIRKQSNLFVGLSSFLCLVMIVSVFVSDLRFKPTYSATDTCDTDECLTVRYGYGPTAPAGTKCYGCSIKCTGDDCNGIQNITVFVYETSASAAKSALKATGDCEEVNDSYCQSECDEACYECQKNGNSVYTYAVGTPNAESLTGGTNCSKVSVDKCSNTSAETPKTTNCYVCKKNGVNNYLYATSQGNAEQASGGTNCQVTSASDCQGSPSVNPPTGTPYIVIAWVVGALAICYSIWYFIKLRAIK